MQFTNTILSVVGLAALISAAPAAEPNKIEARDFTGELTLYNAGLGACGNTNSDTDFIVAISETLYDASNINSNPNDNPLCGKYIDVTYGGKTISVQVEDRCTGCAEYDLDLTPTAFEEFADESVGRLYGATWVWA